ncbi:MAG: D-Ala-D-Ala dipeptidase [Alphaproteobacteria bacterium PRO2]|nr:D-Ala-D-Ala dipeptidase [Alphaproteobacteria bacterium PRO2]
MRKIDPKSLVSMDRLAPENAFRVQLAYARDDNLLFGERIYRPDARLWLHEELAEVVAMAASACFENYDLRFVLYDGLRTIDAQEAMLHTERVRNNPEWLSENLLSRPGMGGHPRGMAVDIGLENEKSELVPMGTDFDFLALDSSPGKNPAHRDYKNLSQEARRNRAALTSSMLGAAKKLKVQLLPLPQEWWDFRLMPDYFNSYAPLADEDLPPDMRMMSSPT